MIKRRKRVNPISKRRRQESSIRNKEWPQFLLLHPNCEIRSPVCTLWTECRHHKKGKIGKLFLDPEFQVASCYSCNSWLETYDGIVWGKKHGFKLDRLAHE